MKVLNFDKFYEETEHEKIEVVVHGETYTIDSAIPAIVPIIMARAEETNDSTIATKAILRAADTMFGKENVDKMCESGMTAPALVQLMQKLFAMINGEDGDDDDGSQEITDEDSRKAVSTNRRKK